MQGRTCSIPVSEIVSFSADDRVKLSYHTDGFVQFSGEDPGKIISGRDPETGAPKGLGLFTHPLATPVWSGPSIAVSAWGIGDFTEAPDTEDGLVFEPDDFYYRGCDPATANTYTLAIYVLPAGPTPPVRYRNGQGYMSIAAERLNGALVSTLEMKVLFMPEEKIVLGLFLNRTVTRFAAPSGWVINGPGDFNRDEPGYTLMAMYPRLEHASPSESRSLNRSGTG